MVSGAKPADSAQPDRVGPVYEDARTRVTRVAVAGRTVIRKEPLGPDAQGRVRRELAVLGRLAGLTGVAQLADEASTDPTGVVLVDAGDRNLASAAKPLSVAELIAVGQQLAGAVAGMHARGVMHRNICPANVVLDDDGTPHLVGFSLATAVPEVWPDFTHPSQIVGTSAYLAPEQTGRTGRAVDERADLYALGATLYELATGAPPFGSGDPLRLLHDHLTQVPAAPAEVNPVVPKPLSEIILHLLEKEPDHRYQSADGLVFDLERLRDPGAVRAGVEFRVGAADLPSRLMAPSRLVGRDTEVAALAAAFEDAVSSGCRGVLVAGVPGVGKTALIDQLRPVVTGRDGWFVAGKFDQYRRDLEFNAGYQAYRALGRLLLAEPEDELAAVRARILAALGPNAGLTTAVLPEFAALLGVPPDPGDSLTAQSRAQWAGVQILRAVASRKRPVLLFLDDLQWGGRTPLGFADLILSGEPIDGLLLVGAYRDNEVDVAHPLAPLLTRWRGQAWVRQVRLDDLPESALATMVAEMLHLDPHTAAGLAGLIASHTRGNPYETVELLNALRQGGVLTATAGGWRWDAATVRAYLEAAEPARLLAGRVAALPAPSQHTVRAMACLGGRAELSLLATATGAPAREVEQHLEPALTEGLLVAESEAGTAVRFRHDRIREATLASLDPPQQRLTSHLAMARRLAEVPEWFAVAAEQYLPVVDAVDDPAERRRVVDLLRRAAEQAALIGEHPLVSTLLGAAARLVDPDQTGTLIAVRTVRHAALFSMGRLDEADDEYGAIDALGPTAAQRAGASTVQVRSLTHRNRFAEAVALGTKTLRQLGIAVPSTGRFSDDLNRQFGHLYRWLEHTDDADELARPEITDPTLLAAAHMLLAVAPAAYFAGDLAAYAWLSLEAVRIWIDHGPASTLVGPIGIAAYAALGVRGDYATGYRASRLVIALGEARGYEPDTSNARHLFSVLACWFEPIENGLDASRRAREGLIAGGDVSYAAYTYYPTVYYLLDCAPSLDAVAAEVRAGLAFTHRTGNEQTSEMLDSYRRLVGVLRGESSDVAQTPPTEGSAGNPLALFHTHVTRAVAAAVLGDAAGLTRYTEAAMPLLPAAVSQYASAVARLLRGLAVAEQARTAGGHDRNGLLGELDELTGWLADRAADAPANFSHLVRLLEAERAWAIGDLLTAELAFDTALREVAQRQRPWHQALTTEHAARFYLSRGRNHFGHQLLAQARAQYAAWGATAKVAQLDWAYPTLQPGAATTTNRTPPGEQPPSRATATTVTSGSIDLLGILSASRALSSETTLDRLHTRVADTLAAMTGATNVRLLLWNQDQHQWLTPGPGGATPIVGGHEHAVPMSVLRYLHRTNEPLLVADATTDDRFARDPYFADTTGCSLLAVPIHSRGALRAVLLLENRLLRGTFTAERLDAVTLIAGQLAVSLDNAGLYAELTASRKRIVATADHTRKRVERDLHDGAQQRLVSLTLQLRMAQARVRPDQPDLATALDHAATEAGAATQELREIAHGLHPSILTTGGLPPALRALARRAPIPVDLNLHLDGRLPEPIEIGAYYIVAEALTNIAKYAQATTATVTVEPDPAHGLLGLTVTDDGVGGADLTGGTGLLGLKDRAEALGGHLSLHSPPGGGTRLHAQLPLTQPDNARPTTGLG